MCVKDAWDVSDDFVVRAPILSSSGSMTSDYSSVVIYPHTSLDVIISNAETGNYSKFICTTVNPLWKISHGWDEWSVCNVPSTIFAANHTESMRCSSTTVGCPIFTASNCAFTKFAFSSKLQDYRYFYSIHGADGQLLYHSYTNEITDEEQIELQKTWIEIPNVIAPGFTFKLFVDNKTSLSLGCETQLMFYNKDVFAGTTRAVVQLSSSGNQIGIITSNVDKANQGGYYWIEPTVTLPSGVSKLEVDLCKVNEDYSKKVGNTTVTLGTNTTTNWTPIWTIKLESTDNYHSDERLGNEAVSAINVNYRYSRTKKEYKKLPSDFVRSSEVLIDRGQESITWEDIATELSTTHEFTNYVQPRNVTLHVKTLGSWATSSMWLETKKTDLILIGYDSSGVPHSAIRYRLTGGGSMLTNHDDACTIIDDWKRQ